MQAHDPKNRIERRHSPRHDIDLPVELVLANGTVLPVQGRSLSGSGMQIQCDSWVADEIEPRGIQVHSLAHIRLKAVVDLPVDGQNHRVYALCKIMSAHRRSQDEYILNLAFCDFEADSAKWLDAFLACQQKKTVIKPKVA